MAWRYPVDAVIKVRKKWSPTVRDIVAEGQLQHCTKCWYRLKSERDLDHLRPLHQRGADEIWNLQMLHSHCHTLKSRVEEPAARSLNLANKKKRMNQVIRRLSSKIKSFHSINS
jgi:5-methylcytosine-specific restriction endonuclease McrA